MAEQIAKEGRLQETMERSAQSSLPEDVFVDLFREVFGLQKAQMLVHEFPYPGFLTGTCPRR